MVEYLISLIYIFITIIREDLDYFLLITEQIKSQQEKTK
jgi:hypothetical protein